MGVLARLCVKGTEEERMSGLELPKFGDARKDVGEKERASSLRDSISRAFDL